MIIISIWLILKGLILVFKNRNGYAVVYILYMAEIRRFSGESCPKMFAERSPQFLKLESFTSHSIENFDFHKPHRKNRQISKRSEY